MNLLFLIALMNRLKWVLISLKIRYSEQGFLALYELWELQAVQYSAEANLAEKNEQKVVCRTRSLETQKHTETQCLQSWGTTIKTMFGPVWVLIVLADFDSK